MEEVEQALIRCHVRTRTFTTKRWRPFRKVLRDLSRKWGLLSGEEQDKCAKMFAGNETDIL